MRLGANRFVAMNSSFNQRHQQHTSTQPSEACRAAGAPVARRDVTMTSFSGIPGGSSQSSPVGVYNLPRESNSEADWLTQGLPVSQVGGDGRRHLQQLELGNNHYDTRKSPEDDSSVADGW